MSAPRPRVLLSARDPGAAAHVAPLARALTADGRVEVRLVASDPALAALTAEAIAVEPFALPGGRAHVEPGGDPAELVRAAAALLARHRPDAVVTGISSLGVGVDEALLAAAGDRPTFALQDYPGDANAIGGAYARCYLVRDEPAARLTESRFPVRALAIGSLRHAAYAALDVAALRADTRRRIGAHPDRTVVGFFGQPPEIPGHEAAFGHLVAALRPRAATAQVLLREHPKAGERRAAHLAALAGAGLAVHDASGDGPVEPWLAACDLVTTCYSHCTMDYAFLDGRSPEPLGSVLFLMTTPEARAYLLDYGGLEAPDGVAQGLGRMATAPAAVEALVAELLAEPARRAFHAASARLAAEHAPRAAVEPIVEAALGRVRAAP